MVRNDDRNHFVDTNLTKLVNKLRATGGFGSSFSGGERCHFTQPIIIQFHTTTVTHDPVKAVYSGKNDFSGELPASYVHAQLHTMSSSASHGGLYLNKGQGATTSSRLPPIWKEQYVTLAQRNPEWTTGAIKRDLITRVADVVERQGGEYLPVGDVGVDDVEIAIIPGTGTPEHMQENLEGLSCELSQEEMNLIGEAGRQAVLQLEQASAADVLASSRARPQEEGAAQTDGEGVAAKRMRSE
jgi:hypothetical protein